MVVNGNGDVGGGSAGGSAIIITSATEVFGTGLPVGSYERDPVPWPVPELMESWAYVASAVTLFFIGFFGFFLNLFVIALMCKDVQVSDDLIYWFCILCSPHRWHEQKFSLLLFYKKKV